MSAEEYVMTVSTTPWGAAVSSANLSTSNTQRGTSETLTSVKVCWEESHVGSTYGCLSQEIVVNTLIAELKVGAANLALLVADFCARREICLLTEPSVSFYEI
jgi:hypothetical protein